MARIINGALSRSFSIETYGTGHFASSSVSHKKFGYLKLGGPISLCCGLGRLIVMRTVLFRPGDPKAEFGEFVKSMNSHNFI